MYWQTHRRTPEAPIIFGATTFRRISSLPRFIATDGGSVDFASVDKITYGRLPTDGENALNPDLSIGG
jgi:hypothetical protein